MRRKLHNEHLPLKSREGRNRYCVLCLTANVYHKFKSTLAASQESSQWEKLTPVAWRKLFSPLPSVSSRAFSENSRETLENNSKGQLPKRPRSGLEVYRVQALRHALYGERERESDSHESSLAVVTRRCHRIAVIDTVKVSFREKIERLILVSTMQSRDPFQSKDAASPSPPPPPPPPLFFRCHRRHFSVPDFQSPVNF
ncbi:hypothetical protein PoB_001327000 [Plakobranchus ocellatus]|uniref:Uncharacterized protein n=1 Tax=Plakobranchus ocellatus TaxID=259542 RepID=A0AAV3YUB0_9GAST|nr:hypothetical protein PoB_001327000 [Plakobranchus ocellatus]